jgi:hypothetical protein
MLSNINHGERNMINKVLKFIHENISEEKSFQEYLEGAVND